MTSDIYDAMQASGLVINGALVMDGEIHRCGTLKKPKSKNGWYCVYDGGIAAIFGNWEYGDGYSYWRGQSVSDIDWRKIQAKIEETRKKKEGAWEAKSQEAVEYIESCAKEGFSEYLKKKQIYPHGALFDGNVVVIPLQDSSGKIWTYQKIYQNGDKYFFPGGKVSGCYYFISGGKNVSKSALVCVCEGFATGATIHQETGIPVIVAFNSGNLKAVADSLPFRNIIIAADNDESGTGEKAAKESGYKYVMPEIVGTDFNDIPGNVLRYFAPYLKTTSNSKTKSSAMEGDFYERTMVSQIASWITRTAIRPQPALSLAAAISFVAMLKGHKIRGMTDLRTNMLILSLAPTGSGKEHPQACIRRLASACGLNKHMMGEPVSGGGFLTGLQEAGRIGLLVMDEMGRFIGNLSHKTSGSYQREIIDYIIKTFSCASTYLSGRQYVDNKKNPRIDIEQPHFCCIGSTVKERLQAACTSSEVVDGFLNRWLVFNVDERPARNKNHVSTEVPEDLITLIRGYTDKGREYDAYGNPQPVIVRFTPEAWDEFDAYRDKMDALVETAGYPLDKLYSRSAEHVEKLAMVFCDDEDVLRSDVLAAIEVVERSNHAVMQFAGLISDNHIEADFIRVREFIKQSGEIKRSQLTYRCQFVQGGAKRIGEIISVLLDENYIAERKDGNKTFYKWIK